MTRINTSTSSSATRVSLGQRAPEGDRERQSLTHDGFIKKRDASPSEGLSGALLPVLTKPKDTGALTSSHDPLPMADLSRWLDAAPAGIRNKLEALMKAPFQTITKERRRIIGGLSANLGYELLAKPAEGEAEEWANALHAKLQDTIHGDVKWKLYPALDPFRQYAWTPDHQWPPEADAKPAAKGGSKLEHLWYILEGSGVVAPTTQGKPHRMQIGSWQQAAYDEALAHRIDPALVFGLIHKESAGQPGRLSPGVKAAGHMQVWPEIWAFDMLDAAWKDERVKRAIEGTSTYKWLVQKGAYDMHWNEDLHGHAEFKKKLQAKPGGVALAIEEMREVLRNPPADDPYFDIYVGCEVLKYYLDMFDGDVVPALLAYYSGPGTANEFVANPSGATLKDDERTYPLRIQLIAETYTRAWGMQPISERAGKAEYGDGYYESSHHLTKGY